MRQRFAATIPICAFLLAAVLGTCRNTVDPMPHDPDAFVVNGTVEFLDLEGGCWAIQVGGRTNYQPLDLPPQFRHDGLEVQTAIRPRDLGGVCQIGPIVEVVWIRGR